MKEDLQIIISEFKLKNATRVLITNSFGTIESANVVRQYDMTNKFTNNSIIMMYFHKSNDDDGWEGV